VLGSQTTNRTLTLPDATDTLVGKATSDTLTNKVLSGNTASNLINGSGTLNLNSTGTVTVPDATDTLMGKATTDTMTNKSFDADGTGNSITNIENADIKALAAIDATKIADGSVSSTEFQYIGGLTSDAQTQLNNKQAVDATLTALAGLDATAGLVVETAADTFTKRSLAAGSSKISIGNADGSAGNPSVDVVESNLTHDNIGGTLGIAKGGTGQTTASAAFDALSPLAGKGSLLTRTVGGHTSLSVGTDGNVLVADSSQSSGLKWSQISGVKNYIANGAAESNTTTGWAVYVDAAASSPTDGTGLLSPATITWSASPGTPLRGSYSFVLTKGGTTSRRGEGVSYDFTIDEADKAKPLSVSFDYKVFSGTYASGDMTVYLYDVTNSQVIQPSGYSILNVSGSAVQKAEFQTNSNSTSYRLIFHIASTSAVDYQMQFDNVVVGPTVTASGSPVTDWQSFTMAITDASNVSVKSASPASQDAKWKRVGDSMLVSFSYAHGGTAGTAGTGSYR
jgi:hypothetical protein